MNNQDLELNLIPRNPLLTIQSYWLWALLPGRLYWLWLLMSFYLN